MPGFSKSSLAKLSTCHQDLYQICSDVIKNYDFTVVCGHRGNEDQDKAVAEGKSHTPWPTSKHNSTPSRAVDIAPYKDGKIDWDDIEAFRELAGHMFAAADKLKVKIKWGGDFVTLRDFPHFELV